MVHYLGMIKKHISTVVEDSSQEAVGELIQRHQTTVGEMLRNNREIYLYFSGEDYVKAVEEKVLHQAEEALRIA